MTDFLRTVLRTDRCLLRPWRAEDTPLIPPVASTRDISWNTSFRFPHPFDETAAKRLVRWSRDGAGEDKWQFAVFLDGELAGSCGTVRGEGVEAHTATTGYWLDPSLWGRGLATEVVTELVRYMRDQTAIEQLTATCFGWNPASRRVLEKTGFRLEGVRRGVVRKWGRTTDLWIYGQWL
ncbi:GCN5-related N-acetyltransferase [Pseudodesulfovibrio mercurii]|uniref:GCN5-related N-acetyltransferase n=1 Tax=Pseudodesulfovibrio mercurii TaxID=641491 RepID=F0JKJ0_9BACT|nr:GNAT family protein [Pseudodesulfovibrio mercurii]EGB16439.1 GCN5-related N-acetyltransferase [Pseudodesulfovibrio mercurii]